jgi:hypothetical protein
MKTSETNLNVTERTHAVGRVRIVPVFTALLLAATLAGPARAQSNIVVNGGFEGGLAGWTVTGGASVYASPLGSLEGTNQLILSVGSVGQDLPTVPGRDYVVRFWGRINLAIVRWAGTDQALVAGSVIGLGWREYSCVVHADAVSTRLEFVNSTNVGQHWIDDVRVGWLDEPVSILDQPSGRTAFEGGSASFVVVAQGGPPLSYQWMFEGDPIRDATSSVLVLADVRASQVGGYSVLVSNVAGAVLSQTAALNVEAPATSPLLLVQPEGQVMPSGYTYTLQSLATGMTPLSYQWYRNGAALAGGTNRNLTLTNIATTNSGTYLVVVSNSLGTNVSLPCVIEVSNSVQGGWVMVTNNTPIRDVDGTTPLATGRYKAQIYVGSSPDALRPMASPLAFRSNAYAGFILAPRFRVPGVVAGGQAYAQMRAWDSFMGQTYEEARGLGGRYGVSEIRQISPSNSPAGFNLVSSFNLRPGLPFFYTGRLKTGPSLPGGDHQFILTGEPGFRYLIESRVPPASWVPLMVVTNTTGTVTFVVPPGSPNAVRFYRSRILD